MRISRVTRIREHRVFKDFTWPSDLHSFGRFNLIYGWNGCGKTTLSSLLSLVEKTTALTEGQVELEFDGTTKVAGSEFASAHLPDVRVFNREFLSAALQSTGGMAPIYFLGEDSVKKRTEVERLKKHLVQADTELATATSEHRDAETKLDDFCVSQAKIIKGVLTSGNSAAYNNYNKAKFRQAVQALDASAAAAAIVSDEQRMVLRSQKDAQPKAAIGDVSAPTADLATLTQEVDALVARSVVAQTLQELTESVNLARWVRDGLALHSGDHASDTCRFCRQTLEADRRSALEGHFNDAFAAFNHDLTSLLSVLKTTKQSTSSLEWPQASRFYDSLVPEVIAASASLSTAVAATEAAIGVLIARVEAKRDNPFTPTGPATATPDIAGPVTDAIRAFNTIVDKHNKTSEDFKQCVDDACRKLEASYVRGAYSDFVQLKQAVKTAHAALDKLKTKPGNIREQIRLLENQILEHQRPADELTTELREYLGRDELHFEVKGTGYALTRNGQAVSHLSEGERTAIAFLYFLKSLQDKSFDMANGVVVIDDPVSSLDANALFSAFGYMKERTKTCGQLFVLTHNFAFFRQVKNWFHHLPKQKSPNVDRRPAKFFLLGTWVDDRGNRSSAIGPLDPLLEKYESEYHYLFRRVYDQARPSTSTGSLEQYYAMPNMARRLLESFLAFRYPAFSGSLVQALEKVDLDSSKKTKILRLLHTYSHADRVGEPGHDPSMLAETPSVLAVILELMEFVDPNHYAGMVESLTRKDSSG